MIPKAHVLAWRARAPWSDDAQVEQDLVLSRALVDLFSRPAIADRVALRGGTALNKLHFDSPARYSEDIDLVQVVPGPAGEALDALRACLDPWLGQPRWKQTHAHITFTYRFEAETVPAVPLRLKVEMYTREHFNVMGLRQVPFAVESPWYTGTCEVPTFHTEELLGTKMRALYQRKKGRDLFDLATTLARFPDLDRAAVLACFQRYMAHEGVAIDRATYATNLAAKMDDPAFTGDLRPLLVAGHAYDAEKAHEIAVRELLALLPDG